MKFVAVSLLCLALFAVVEASKIPTDEEISVMYESFLKQHRKNLLGAELGRRYLIFKENVLNIAQHNAGNHGYTLEVNEWADMTFDEWASTKVAAEQACSATNPSHLLKVSKKSDLPKSVDWRETGIVSPVKNQAKCGSCWTFSTTGAIEAHWAKKTGLVLDLSEQQLLDCAGDFDNHGCKGGLPSHAFEYIKYNGGINSDYAYPYEARDNGTCRFVPRDIVAIVPGGAVNITQGSDLELTDALAHVGPVSVAFQVIPDFRFYKSGVFSSDKCGSGSQDVNHAVLAVGYGTEADGTEYYIIKNSWGAAWGDNGYFKIARDKNMCGIATCASYPKV